MTRAEAVNKLMQAGIDHDADYLADALSSIFYGYMHPELHCYVCECFKCGFKYYTSIKQCNCPRCGCDGEHFRCSELK